MGSTHRRRGEGDAFVVIEGTLSGITLEAVRRRVDEYQQAKDHYKSIEVVQKGEQVAFVIEGGLLNMIAPPTDDELRTQLSSVAGRLLWPLMLLQVKAQYYLRVSPIHLVHRRAKKLVEMLCQ